MKKDDLKQRRMLMLGFAVPMVGFLLWRLSIIAPQLGGYIVKVVLATIVIAVVYTAVRRRVASKCPKCGGAMENMGMEKITKGAVESSTGQKLDSLAKQIYRCEQCGNEYHELIHHISSSGDVADYEKDLKASEAYLHVLRSEIPGQVKELKVRQLTREEYRAEKRRYADEVMQHNRRNGFEKDGIKIDVEE